MQETLTHKTGAESARDLLSHFYKKQFFMSNCPQEVKVEKFYKKET